MLCPNCSYQESGKGKNGVKGYIKINECADCKAQREVDALNSKELRENDEVSLMIAQESQDISKEKLLKDGKIKVVDGKLKKV